MKFIYLKKFINCNQGALCCITYITGLYRLEAIDNGLVFGIGRQAPHPRSARGKLRDIADQGFSKIYWRGFSLCLHVVLGRPADKPRSPSFLMGRLRTLTTNLFF
jgi:hypothetical protein